MARRSDFGRNWQEVVAEWCSGVAPPLSAETGWDSLGVLERLWPQFLDKILTDGVKSRLVIADAAEYGTVISVCQNLEGFDNVIRRLRTGDKAALSELALAAALVKAGYSPTLEPELHG